MNEPSRQNATRAEDSDNDPFTMAELNELLFHADPSCLHKLDRDHFDGIRCTRCPGWFCY